MREDLIKNKLVPLDKSWIIRMGVLDLINGYDDTIRFLKKQPEEELGDDLVSLLRASLQWEIDGCAIDVGESATLYRMLRFVSWDKKLEKKFIVRGTLKHRVKNMKDLPKMLNWSVPELLIESPMTTQRASASYLIGRTSKMESHNKREYNKLFLTYEAKEHWLESRAQNRCWAPKYDETIIRQAEAYQRKLNNEPFGFEPKHSEDACFAIAFDIKTLDQAESEWPSIVNHESNRIKEMGSALEAYEKGAIIVSDDHRVVSSMAMKCKVDNNSLSVSSIRNRFSNPDCVSKAWPMFWRFLNK